jgi:dTDP-4-amino-4,6-dideoxygalactose transaminase
MAIRLSRSLVGQEEKDALARVIDAGYLGMGEEVRLFEQEIGAYLDTDRHVVCVATGTAALQLAVSSLGLGAGDEVLVPTITYVASFQAIRAAGAKPVACDVRPGDLYLDMEDAARRLTPRTRAIMPVHYASGSRGLDAVYEFARRHGLRVIEDAAHSFGGSHGGRKVGADGDVVCFSFDGIKNITSGEGGAILTGDAEVARLARDARLLGVERDTEARFSAKRSWNFDVQHQGYRYHMSNLMAAVGRAQLAKVDTFSERRRAVAARYREALSGLNAVTVLDLNWDEIVPHIFVIRVSDGRRDALGDFLKGKGIESGFHYQPNHKLSLFADGGAFPRADKAAEEILTIPLHAALSDAEQDEVIAAIREFSGTR